MGVIDIEQDTKLVYPHRLVSRAEFLKMVTKAYGLTTNIPHQYTDINTDDWYTQYIGLSWRYSLFTNTNNPNLLRPKLHITHSEAIEVIYKLLTAEPTLQPTPNMFPVAKKAVSGQQTNFLKQLLNTIQPTVQKILQQKPSTIRYNLKNVKDTILKGIWSRSNQAQHTKNDLIEAVNNVRSAHKLKPVRNNYYLDLSAQRHAKDMVNRGYFNHFTPEGLSYVDRIKSAGYLDIDPALCSCNQQFDLRGTAHEKNQDCLCEPVFSVGENLAKGQLSVEQVMKEWLNSPKHRATILRPQFEEIGIGLFDDVWVQNFGSIQLP